ncbi:DUF7373 family lipoprotein [Aeromicrobium alkaliterrae]|uniref:Uncharacterized protein n=1 Tax=Aeromicrobium alkaliterrae TaxID=302168 RepID=A0ABP4WKU0_9ACTN
MLRRAVATAASLVVVLSGLTACGGGDEPDPEPSPTAAFDPEALDLGRIEPTGTDLSTALTGTSSRLVAAYTLAANLVLPQDLRSDLTKYGIESGTLVDPNDYEYMLGDAAPAMAGAETGYLTRRTDQDADAWITTSIVQFPDEAAAQNAVQTAAASMAAPDVEFGVDLVVEPYPADEAAVTLVTNTPDVANQIYVLRAYGSFLTYAWVYDINGTMDDVREHADEFLADQEVALEDAERVTISEAPRLRDLDPTGIWGLTLAPDARGSLSETAYTAGSHAAETRQINVDGVSRAFTKAGVSRVASNLTSIYVAENAEGAKSLVEAFLEQATGLGMVEAESPQGLDEASCLANEDEENPDLTFWPAFLCFYPYGAYLLESSGVSLEEAQQRLSAQAVLVYEAQRDQKRSSG